jgi:heme a synthase
LLVTSSAYERRFPDFARYAWLVLGYTLFVILFGAWVRISGSGAGCGEHWPMCNGQVLPRSPTAKTVIEFTHRLTSGLLGPMVVTQLIWAWAGAGRRRGLGVLASLFFVLVIVEALLGRSLVVAELVGDNASVKRAVVVALHLGNTLLLMFAATATAWLGAGGAWPRLRSSFAGRGWLCWALFATALVSMMGAVTALGDTLFPVEPTLGAGLLAHIKDDLSQSAHFLVRLRVIHPMLATGLCLALLALSQRYGHTGRVAGRVSALLGACTGAQLLVGLVNIALGAPAWIQLLHLLLAQAVWISLVVLLLELARTGGGPAFAAADTSERAAPLNSDAADAANSQALADAANDAAEEQGDSVDASSPAVLPIEDSIDLHAFAPRDVLSVVDAYLEAAHEIGFTEVRLIHGRGTGFQRASVQRLLRTHPLVERFGDAPATRGGWGATLAWLKPPAE